MIDVTWYVIDWADGNPWTWFLTSEGEMRSFSATLAWKSFESSASSASCMLQSTGWIPL